MNARKRSRMEKKDDAWLITVDERLFRWSISADDDGIQIHVQFHPESGTVLVVDGLFFDPLPNDWRRGEQVSDQVRFTALPDVKVAQLIRAALKRGWRHDLDQKTFTL